jgi:hypothetical protein
MQHSCSGRRLGAGRGATDDLDLKPTQGSLWQTGTAGPWARRRRSRTEAIGRRPWRESLA